jgi:hypothetical protein
VTAASDGQLADPLDPARTVRRALADAGRKAVEVDAIVVAASIAAPGKDIDAFIRTALGRHGAGVEHASVADGAVIAAAGDALGVGATRDALGAIDVVVGATGDAAVVGAGTSAVNVGVGTGAIVVAVLSIGHTTLALCLGSLPQSDAHDEPDHGPRQQ